MDAWEENMHDALNKLRRANQRGTGCHLSAQEVRAMKISFLGQAMEEPDPRAAKALQANN